MKSVAVRWGYVYLMMLIIVVGIGFVAQKERRQLSAYKEQYEQLEQERVRLSIDYQKRLSDRAVARWAEDHGMIPLSKGRWAE